MQVDLSVAAGNEHKLRRDWGTQNVVGVGLNGGPKVHAAQGNVQHKVATFIARGIYPQQLSIPRQYSTTSEGVFIHTEFEGRIIDGVQEQGARLIVQENAKMARFVVSPLFDSIHDARSWAKQNMGVL